MKIAVEGCAHGELDKIYEALETLEKQSDIKVDLLIICGDFQSVRNPSDLECMAVSSKYRKLNTFYKYYAGERVAPVLTIFIGGNHEASNYLSELSYGGWVCPNIYYMGYANVINIGGVRIAGLSGIFKGGDYTKGHFERPPYNESSKRSVYHVRNVDVFRLKQLKKPIDICFSHDWPRGVYNHGNKQALLRKKPFFRQEVEDNRLGSQAAEELLETLKPTYWFAAHLHCKFVSLVPHMDKERPFTKFLALDKCLPHRNFLQVVEIENMSTSMSLEYDSEWLSILKSTNHLLNTSQRNRYMPGVNEEERWDFTPSNEEMENVKKLLGNDMKIPNNFSVTAPTHDPSKPSMKKCKVEIYPNPQTQRFCQILNITNPFATAAPNISTSSLSISDFFSTDNDTSYSSMQSTNPVEISLSDEDETEDISLSLAETDVSDAGDFFIDRIGAHNSSLLIENLNSTDFFIDRDGSQCSPGQIASNSKNFAIDKSGFGDSPQGKSLSSSFDNDKNKSHLLSNEEMFLQTQFCSTPIVKGKSQEQFPELKKENNEIVEEVQTTPREPVAKRFKRRNFSLYNSGESTEQIT